MQQRMTIKMSMKESEKVKTQIILSKLTTCVEHGSGHRRLLDLAWHQASANYKSLDSFITKKLCQAKKNEAKFIER